MKKIISIVIPIYNESESIFKLIDEIIFVLSGLTIEILIVNDGSSDSIKRLFKPIKKKKVSLKLVQIIIKL